MAQISGLIKPYCSVECLPKRLLARLRVLVTDPMAGLNFSLPFEDEGEVDGNS